jgi:hypothetical protein
MGRQSMPHTAIKESTVVSSANQSPKNVVDSTGRCNELVKSLGSGHWNSAAGKRPVGSAHSRPDAVIRVDMWTTTAFKV